MITYVTLEGASVIIEGISVEPKCVRPQDPYKSCAEKKQICLSYDPKQGLMLKVPQQLSNYSVDQNSFCPTASHPLS